MSRHKNPEPDERPPLSGIAGRRGGRERAGSTQSAEGYWVVIDPRDIRRREARVTEGQAVADPAGVSNSKSTRVAKGDVITLERRSRRRLQKKLFIAKARRDVA